MLRDIHRDNQQLVLDQQVYSPLYVNFVRRVVQALVVQNQEAGSDAAPPPDLVYLRSLPVLKWATGFTLQVLAHFQDNSSLGEFVDALMAIYRQSPQSCVWLVDLCARDPSFALSVLVTASDKTVRTHVARLLVDVIDVVVRLEARYLDDMEPVTRPDGSVGSQPKSAVARLLATLFSLIPDAVVHWPKFRQFWWVYEQIAVRSHAGRSLLMQHGAITRLLAVFLGTRCPLVEPGSIRQDVGNAMVTPGFGPLLSCVAALVCHSETPASAAGRVRLYHTSFVEELDPLLAELNQAAALAPSSAPAFAPVVASGAGGPSTSTAPSAPPCDELSPEVLAAISRAEADSAPKSLPATLAAVATPVLTTVDMLPEPLFHMSPTDLQCVTCPALYELALEREFNLTAIRVIITRLCTEDLQFTEKIANILLGVMGHTPDLKLGVFWTIAADITRIEAAPPARLAALERVLGVPIVDRSAGYLGFAYSRRYRPTDRSTFECLRYLFALAEAQPAVGTYLAGLTADVAEGTEPFTAWIGRYILREFKDAIDQISIIPTYELSQLSDVFSAFEIKLHGRASPKPITPPVRRRLDYMVRQLVYMDTYEELNPSDPLGSKYVVYVCNMQPGPVDFFASWPVMYSNTPNFVVPPTRLHCEIAANDGVVVFESYKVDPTLEFQYLSMSYQFAPVTYRTNPPPRTDRTVLTNCVHVTKVVRPAFVISMPRSPPLASRSLRCPGAP